MIAPSILSADFARLGEEIRAVAGSGENRADWVHVDVMDGHFVPNLTLGLPVVQSLIKSTDVPIDCHLMIDDPDRWAIGYAEAGAYNVTVHVEAAADPVKLAKDLRAAGAKAGLSVKPNTRLEDHLDVLKHYDTLLVMSVEPGFDGPSPGRHRPPQADRRDRRWHQRRHDRTGRRGGRRLLRRRFGRLRRERPRQGHRLLARRGRAGRRSLSRPSWWAHRGTGEIAGVARVLDGVIRSFGGVSAVTATPRRAAEGSPWTPDGASTPRPVASRNTGGTGQCSPA
jgi:ribulose-phosphate 3-epimerase